jgi:hypothetical protein
LNDVSKNLAFLYSHNTDPGHSPSGLKQCNSKNQMASYFSKVKRANKEMLRDLEAIADLDNSIVILAGDHVMEQACVTMMLMIAKF